VSPILEVEEGTPADEDAIAFEHEPAGTTIVTTDRGNRYRVNRAVQFRNGAVGPWATGGNASNEAPDRRLA
jgi:hypothetical protein